MRKRIKPYLREFENQGCDVVEIAHGGRHMRIIARRGNREHKFTISYSPSDSRTFQNFRAQLRRWVRGQR